MLEAVARGKDTVVDLTRITYIDSSGIASLVEALQAAGKAGTGFSLAAVCPEAMRVFKLARLDIVFPTWCSFAPVQSQLDRLNPSPLSDIAENAVSFSYRHQQ